VGSSSAIGVGGGFGDGLIYQSSNVDGSFRDVGFLLHSKTKDLDIMLLITSWLMSG
jgi:hypothetical protein